MHILYIVKVKVLKGNPSLVDNPPVYQPEKSKQKGNGKRRPRNKGFKTSKEVINSRKNVEEAELKEGIRTILKPGELEEILETGTFDWNAQRIKRYGIEDSEYENDEYEYEYEYEEEEEHKDKVKDDVPESDDNSKLETDETEADRDEEESSSKRRKRILNLVEQLLNMKSDE